MMNFNSVLIASPTSKTKSYCDKQWIANVLKFKYPNFKIRLFDNTLDNGVYASTLTEWYKDTYNDDLFECIASFPNASSAPSSLIERMAKSHNDCREYALANGFDYLLHLESDVFPQHDVIENLMMYRKDIIGGLFYRDSGISRMPMLQRGVMVSPMNYLPINYDVQDDLTLCFNELHKVHSLGLGCVLINKKTIEKVPFRFEPNINSHPDSFFAIDCHKNNIPIWLAPANVCRHDNQPWGLYGVDFK